VPAFGALGESYRRGRAPGALRGWVRQVYRLLLPGWNPACGADAFNGEGGRDGAPMPRALADVSRDRRLDESGSDDYPANPQAPVRPAAGPTTPRPRLLGHQREGTHHPSPECMRWRSRRPLRNARILLASWWCSMASGALLLAAMWPIWLFCAE